MDLINLAVLGVIVVLWVGMFAVSFWRQSERQRQRWESRRGEDEAGAEHNERGAFRSHWGGYGRPFQH